MSVKPGNLLRSGDNAHSISEFSSNHASDASTPVALDTSHIADASLWMTSAMLSMFHCVPDCAMREVVG